MNLKLKHSADGVGAEMRRVKTAPINAVTSGEHFEMSADNLKTLKP
jgi:hypothetical protein